MTQATCTIDGCDKPRDSRGWCNMHYTRWRRHGDPTIRHPGAYEVKKRSDGYLIVCDRTHPLARSGVLAQHRQVLYDHIGPGEHRCFWCDTEIEWTVPGQPAPPRRRQIHVDHLNGKRDDNRIANLVPACCSCNQSRGGHNDPERNAIYLATRRVLRHHADELATEIERARKLFENAGCEMGKPVDTPLRITRRAARDTSAELLECMRQVA